ncbi:unnamed protein product [Amoebophrya sp. A25]|nr:unnamed protein product [Amoebophrya sp. A25]|eukprot:GSA25T00023889001.1
MVQSFPSCFHVLSVAAALAASGVNGRSLAGFTPALAPSTYASSHGCQTGSSSPPCSGATRFAKNIDDGTKTNQAAGDVAVVTSSTTATGSSCNKLRAGRVAAATSGLMALAMRGANLTANRRRRPVVKKDPVRRVAVTVRLPEVLKVEPSKDHQSSPTPLADAMEVDETRDPEASKSTVTVYIEIPESSCKGMWCGAFDTVPFLRQLEEYITWTKKEVKDGDILPYDTLKEGIETLLGEPIRTNFGPPGQSNGEACADFYCF